MADKKIKERELFEVLRLVSPGTVLRTALDDILRAGMGALIVLHTKDLEKLLEGGFSVDCELTSQKITELAKMDGAIVLSSDLDKILNANVLLVPDISIPTSETGTRHKAAERIAKQADTLCIAVSERRKKITVYSGSVRYILQNTEEVLGRATQTLQILEKQREIFDELLANLNVLEISGLTVANDVCSVLQRVEIITRTAKSIDRYLIELGREGNIIRMRLRELLKGIDHEKEMILGDYKAEEKKFDELSDFSFDDLLSSEKISELLFSIAPEEKLAPRGHRILNKTDLNSEDVSKLVNEFKTLSSIIEAEPDKIEAVIGENAENLQKEISSLKEQIMMARKI